MSGFAGTPDGLGLPSSAPGMRIGLFGGSFNPPHQGHRLVSRQVLKRLHLDAVWWLVSPGNPLKDHAGLAPLDERIAAAWAMVDHPRVSITGYEATGRFAFSYQTVAHLTKTLADRHFVWIMGSDNLLLFHRWERWRAIAAALPIAVYARPGATLQALSGPAARVLDRWRLPESEAAALPGLPPPAWVFLNGIMSGLSSTEIRARRTASPGSTLSGGVGPVHNGPRQ